MPEQRLRPWRLLRAGVWAFGTVVVLADGACARQSEEDARAVAHPSAAQIASPPEAEQKQPYRASKRPVPPQIVEKMKRYSWREGCPVAIADLSHLELGYWGYDDAPHLGELIVHAQVADEVMGIFGRLYEARFPLGRMELVDAFAGSDEASMAADNTSAFNCRPKLGRARGFSKHSYGVAIDINPMHNPYQSARGFGPPNGEPYLSRDPSIKGVLLEDGVAVKTFREYGWTWGGSWTRLRDYHHFEKPMGTARSENR